MGKNENNRQNYASNVYDISAKKPLQKQKSSAEKRKRKRIIRVSIFFLAVIAVFIGIFILIAQLFFNVSTITVEYTNSAADGKRYYTNKDITVNSTIQEGDGLLFLNSSKIETTLEKNLPYISQVTIRKDLPSGIIIEVTECAKVYCFNSSTGYYLVNEEGKLLERTNEDAVEKYTAVKCKSITADVVGEKITLEKDTETIFSYLELIRKSGLKITAVDFTDMDDVYMDYDNRISIHIGKMADEKNGVTAWKKLQLAKKSLDAEDKVNPEQKGTLNMTISKKAYFKAESDLPEEN